MGHIFFLTNLEWQDCIQKLNKLLASHGEMVKEHNNMLSWVSLFSWALHTFSD